MFGRGHAELLDRAQGDVSEKPAVLFARSEFHHIAGSVPRDGIDKAFERIETAGDEDYARHLYWFFHTDMIDGASKDAEAQVLARVRRFGWDL
ncbi:MAG: hypothetical protein R3D84_01880 [Paracoccaceae bacterium]